MLFCFSHLADAPGACDIPQFSFPSLSRTYAVIHAHIERAHEAAHLVGKELQIQCGSSSKILCCGLCPVTASRRGLDVSQQAASKHEPCGIISMPRGHRVCSTTLRLSRLAHSSLLRNRPSDRPVNCRASCKVYLLRVQPSPSRLVHTMHRLEPWLIPPEPCSLTHRSNSRGLLRERSDCEIGEKDNDETLSYEVAHHRWLGGRWALEVEKCAALELRRRKTSCWATEGHGD